MMGMLFRMFAPKPLKRARRATHPGSLLTPRSVKRVKRTAMNVANPLGATKRAAKTSAVRTVRGRPSGKGRRATVKLQYRCEKNGHLLNHDRDVCPIDGSDGVWQMP
jgi:hypothetical protein